MSFVPSNSPLPVTPKRSRRDSIHVQRPGSPLKQLAIVTSPLPISTEPQTPASHRIRRALSFPATPIPIARMHSFAPSTDLVDGINHWRDNLSSTAPSSPLLARPSDTHEAPCPLSSAVVEGLYKTLAFTSRYFLDVFYRAAMWLRSPFAFLLSIGLFFITIILISSYFRAVFSGICVFPGTSRLPLCQPVTQDYDWKGSGHFTSMSEARAPESVLENTRLTETPAVPFQKLLERAAADKSRGAVSSFGIWKLEMETENLIALVRASDLPGRNTFTEILEHIGESTEGTAWVLQNLDSQIVGVADGYVPLFWLDLCFHLNELDAASCLCTILSYVQCQRRTRNTHNIRAIHY